MKLFTIGDSLGQGFRSLAVARTDQCFSTRIAQVMGLDVSSETEYQYAYPEWPEGGLGINLERILRRLEKRYGTTIKDLEWLTVLGTINDVIDESERYYERGAGAETQPYPHDLKYFHNVAVAGFEVADAWMVTANVAKDMIEEKKHEANNDGFLTGASAEFYRNSLKVLNPSLDAKYMEHSALDWLREHARGDEDGKDPYGDPAEGVENVILWLGANNALSTVIGLKLHTTDDDPEHRPYQLPRRERDQKKWNLWRPNDFRADYAELMRRVDAIMKENKKDNWRVFLGTVPLVTICPLIKGVGKEYRIEREEGGKTVTDIYSKYYTYFPFEEEFAQKGGPHINLREALQIDGWIRRYNQIIRQLAQEYNEAHDQERYVVVETGRALEQMAWKRRGGNVQYRFPDYFDDAPTRIDTKYYHVDADGRMRQGGFFSLDGVHPTAIGHGLIAHEFLKAMEACKVKATNRRIVRPEHLNWPAIFKDDSLYQHPIRLMAQIRDLSALINHLVRLLSSDRGWASMQGTLTHRWDPA